MKPEQALRTARTLAAVALAMTAAGCAATGPARQDIDPAARVEIDRMREAVSGQSRYAMTIESMTDEPTPSGRTVQTGRTTEIRVERPDRLAVTVERDSGERWSAWLAGGDFVLFDETGARCARLALPPAIDDALEALADEYGLHLPLADIVSARRRGDLMARVESGFVVGTDTVAGRPCRHLLFRQPVADWQVWIEEGEPALPRRIRMTYQDEPGRPAYDATIVAWDLDPRFDDAAWTPALPPEVREVPIDELLGPEESE